MAIPVSNSIPASGDPRIDGLIQGSSWQFAGPAVLNYSLSVNDNGVGGTWAARPDMSAAVAQALSAWSNVANITFVQSGSGTIFEQSTADLAITLTGSDLSRLQASSLGIFPDHTFATSIIQGVGYSLADYPKPEGDVFLDNFQSVFFNVQPGSLGYQYILHEIGHALGLKHPFDDGGNARPTFAQLGLGAYDNSQYTVMSYNIASLQANSDAATPMLFDILAIQRIYGANMTFHAGNDTYQLQTYDNAIWDAGGTDTLDASTSGFGGAVIDLRQGGFSYSMFTPTVVTGIAYGVTIENAIGSFGNDTIIGNDADNNIDGQAGADTMVGGKGNDTYIVDNPGDTIIEDPGAGTDLVQSSASFMLPANVENLTLTGNGDINGTGNELANVINGNSGANTLSGGAGNDVLIGGGGNDTMAGGPGGDTFVINNFGSTVKGGPTSFQLQGQSNEYVSGGQNLSFNSSDGNFFANLFTNQQGLVDIVEISFQGTGANSSHFWHFNFSTRMLAGDPALVAGQYLNADRALVGNPGQAGLDVFGDGRGSNQVFGSFTVTAADFNYNNPNNPTITDLSVSFVQHSESPTNPTLTGTINFNYAPAPPTANFFPVVMENPNEGLDTVQTSLDGYVLPANVENLTLTGNSNLTGTGNNLDNVLTSNSGIDTLAGGLGNDTYVLNNTGDVVTENPGEGIDTVVASFSLTLAAAPNLENVTLTGSAGLTATGNASDNVLTGNTGVDTLIGGLGNDTYVITNPVSIVTENPGEGTDTVQLSSTFSGTSYLLPTNVENGTNLGAVTLTLFGNTLDNTLTGGTGADVFNGGLGNDTLIGGGGFDIATYSGSQSGYTITPTHGTFTVNGADGNDTVSGVEKLTFGDGSVKLLGSVAHASGADLFGNGFGDILWRNDTGAAALWSLNGTTVTGGGLVNGGAAVTTDWNIAGTTDFNGDGHGDILWRNDDGRVAEWSMSGTSITGGGFVNGGAAVSSDWQIAGVGDFSGDHKGDILWHNADGRIALWQMDGANIVGGGFINGGAAVSPDWSIAGTTDFTGDGKTDILWRNVDGRVAEWSIDGTMITGGGIVNGGTPVTPDWHIAGVGDFSGDHKGDILWQNNDGRLALWQMDGANIIGGGLINGGAPVTADWQIAGVGDFSGDGKSDILWRNDDGRVGEWTMNGTAIAGGGFVNNNTPVPHDWIVT